MSCNYLLHFLPERLDLLIGGTELGGLTSYLGGTVVSWFSNTVPIYLDVPQGSGSGRGLVVRVLDSGL